jgi:hypothetical protein
MIFGLAFACHCPKPKEAFMKKKHFVLMAALVLMAGCRVNKTENSEGETKIEVEPAKVELGTDTQTVTVPTVNVAPDSANTTTTNQ